MVPLCPSRVSGGCRSPRATTIPSHDLGVSMDGTPTDDGPPVPRRRHMRSIAQGLVLASVLLSSCRQAVAQDAYPPGTYAHAVTTLGRTQLEEWLQRHVPGLVTYSGPRTPRSIDPGAAAVNRSEIEYASTVFRKYTWTNCTLRVEEAQEEGTWLVPPELQTTARVAMTDVSSVSAGVMVEGEGPVGLHLTASAGSTGNSPDGRSVRLLARYPSLVLRVLLRYSEMCKGRIP